MSRIRTIKPELPLSESMGNVSRDARLIFILMWPHCDDAGRIRASSRALASLLCPYDNDAPALMPQWLDALEKQGCIRRYEVDGAHYLQVVNFLKHQKIDHPSKSNIPAPREPSREIDEPSRKLAQDQGPRTKDQGEECTKDKTSRAKPRALGGEPFPGWWPLKEWAAFLEMRHRQRAPPTDYAVTLLRGKLESWHADGHDVAAILNQSTENSWKGVFLPHKDKSNGQEPKKRQPTAHDRHLAGLASLLSTNKNAGGSGGFGSEG